MAIKAKIETMSYSQYCKKLQAVLGDSYVATLDMLYVDAADEGDTLYIYPEYVLSIYEKRAEGGSKAVFSLKFTQWKGLCATMMAHSLRWNRMLDKELVEPVMHEISSMLKKLFHDYYSYYNIQFAGSIEETGDFGFKSLELMGFKPTAAFISTRTAHTIRHFEFVMASEEQQKDVALQNYTFKKLTGVYGQTAEAAAQS